MISHRPIVQAAKRRPDAAAALDNWYRITKRASWRNLVDTRGDFPHADFVEGLTVFNIKGNDYRLITRINYTTQKVFVRGFFTHSEYKRGGWKE
ncbi:MAG: type II toxin-antitoxin system HigB family toxin [Acidobacteria bacterium]|nr:type II toxin-antitoxin system HigB family toxin [Acidobacteriota bacterium]